MKKLINTTALLIIFLHLNPSVQTQRIIYSISRRPRNQSEEYEQQQWQTNYGSNSTIIHTITNSTLLLRNQHETGRKRTATTTTIVSNDTKDGRSLLRTKRFLKHMPKTSKFHNRTKTIQDSSRDDQDEPQSSHGPKFGNKNISMVLAELLDHYDHNQRPGYGGQAAVITTNLEIRSMGPISELDMEYSLDCYFRQKWQDERLRFTGNANFLSLNIKMLDKIWKPDTYFHTGKASHLHMITTPNKFLRIFKNGLVLYSMRLTIKSLCPMDLHSFPMDKQSCPLILGSYGFPADQLVYSWDAKPVTFNQKDFTLSQFDIVKTIYRNGTIPFKRGNHSMLQVNFNLRRHVGYFLIQIYVPCSLIVVLSWVSFWINREATSDRVGLGVTAVLTLSTFGLDSRSDLPRVSYATALDWYTVMCFLFVVFTLLEFAGVHYFTKVGTGEMPVIEIDDDWTKSSDSDEQQQQQEMDSRNQSEDQKNIIQERGKHRNPSASQLRHRRVHHRPRHRSSRQKTSSKKLKSRKKLTHVVVPRSSSGQLLNIRKFNNNNNDNDNQLSDYDETMDDNPIVHMPHCPRYRHCRQQKLRRPMDDDNYVHDGQEWIYPPSSSSTRHHYIRNRHHQHYSQQQQPQQQSWRLNSSWPTLAWGYDGGHDKSKNNHNFNRQSHLKPPELLEHYSFNQLTRTDHDFNDFDYEFNLNDKEDIVSDIVHDDDEDDDGEDDDDGGTSDSNNNDHVRLNFCLWRQVFNPLSQCCREFWYCFTANEQFKKEMKRRRTKGQGMCAVNSVSMIDKVSRILFPLVFFILNTAYWSFYINERNADFQQWET